ncbi:uncharacterized protein Bfra_006401 [Botrytis fragariae]|uniref:Uncharacterized protein n=1 Tax=Botrytis fragariae TaxID=1964551 RepID=A0A8H6ENT1_9HELO|nr:uncharacterized protein Bfra_006401 [Botrytis fragariae]KAF5879196.1 hypothetical protein Bfra_006401 [Botrytis fragariae]
MAMLEASSKPRGSGQQGKDEQKQGFLQENTCEKNSEKVHEKPAKESMFSIFEFPKSEPNLNAQEKKVEKEKKKEIERKIKENERIEKEKKDNKRKMDKKIKDEEKRMIENEISQVKVEYKERQKRNDLARAEFRRVQAEQAKLYPSSRDGQARRETYISLQQEWRYRDERAKYEKDHRIEQLKSNLKALDLQLTVSGGEILRLHQLKEEDEISKEQARERLRKSTEARKSAAQARQTTQSGKEEPTKKCILPVVSQEVNSSMEDNPFYLPGEFKYQQMGEWDSDTCKEWIYDSLENGLTSLELQQLFFKLINMPRIGGKRMFGATEEEWVEWLATHGLLIHDKLQRIAEVRKVDM